MTDIYIQFECAHYTGYIRTHLAFLNTGRIRHAGRVPPDHKKLRAGHLPRPRVELDLRRPRVHHRSGPDGEDGRGLVEHPLREHGLVLLDAHVERHVACNITMHD